MCPGGVACLMSPHTILLVTGDKKTDASQPRPDRQATGAGAEQHHTGTYCSLATLSCPDLRLKDDKYNFAQLAASINLLVLY